MGRVNTGVGGSRQADLLQVLRERIPFGELSPDHNTVTSTTVALVGPAC